MKRLETLGLSDDIEFHPFPTNLRSFTFVYVRLRSFAFAILDGKIRLSGVLQHDLDSMFEEEEIKQKWVSILPLVNNLQIQESICTNCFNICFELTLVDQTKISSSKIHRNVVNEGINGK